ncbi:MAG: formylglycine-generating enzyme family protein [Bacteriovoracaceae bacterium]|jgi:formylglycine-generating enzyme required for sulfatase activity|nr:formylglycine-generating enzyme family protein [Bacteriovoracaceae bacterium]
MKYLLLLMLVTSIFYSCKEASLDFENLESINNIDSKSLPVEFKPPGIEDNEKWIEVPANAGGMGLSKFYVMKYEAKAMLISDKSINTTGTTASTATHKPVSIATNQPWRNINANQAAAECESLGSGYRLISNEEWMAIARDVEDVDANWTGGSVGSGCLFAGKSSSGCGYSSGATPDHGETRNIRAGHTLKNGKTIFDLSGNLTEWVDWDKSTPGFQLFPSGCAVAWQEVKDVSCAGLTGADVNTANGTLTSADGIGRFMGGSWRAAMRGGDWRGSLTMSGLYHIAINGGTGNSNIYLGFRCVYSE